MLGNSTRKLIAVFVIVFFITPLSVSAQLLPGGDSGNEAANTKNTQQTFSGTTDDENDPMVVTLDDEANSSGSTANNKKKKPKKESHTQSYLGGLIGVGLGASGASISDFFTNLADFSNPRINLTLGIFYEIRPYSFFSIRLEFTYQQLFLMADEGSIAAGTPIIMAALSPGIRFYLGCPLYLGVAGDFGVASSTSTTAYTGFHVELGYLFPITKNSAIDLGVRYNFYPTSSSVAQYLSQNDVNVTCFHAISLVLGFSAVL